MADDGDIMKRLLVKSILKIYHFIFFILGSLLPKNKKLIIFESFLGKQFSDNPRAIFEYMCEHCPDYDMYWSVDRRYLGVFEQHTDVQYVQRFTLKWLFLMTRSKYWITNSRLPLWIPKPKKTIYLQTWHGTPLKKLATDIEEVHMPGINTLQYKGEFLKEARKWDYLISPNAYSTKIFQRAFQFKGTIIESGYPRNDFLINANDERTIFILKEKLNIPLNKKVILYAPTWRDNQYHSKGKYAFNLQLDLDYFKKELGDDYVVLLRLHYLVSERLNLKEHADFVVDYSYHEDIRDLYLVSDLLITDYSSVFFDYANLKRPMLFYVPDIDDYRDNIRGFYFDFESSAPGPLMRTTEDLIYFIKKVEQNRGFPTQSMEEFYKKICYLEDGNASMRVVKEVLGLNNK